MKTLLKGAIGGGLILFLWGMVSWMVLPFHMNTFQKFKDEGRMERSLEFNAEKSGVYVLPNCSLFDEGISKEEKNEIKKLGQMKMEKGPFAFVVYKANGMGKMTHGMIKGLLIQFLGAFLVTWLLIKTQIQSFSGRVFFVFVFSLAAGVVTHLPSSNWFGFPAGFVMLDMLDLVIGWTLAGFLLSKVVGPPKYL